MKIRKRNWIIFGVLIVMIGIITWWFNRHHTYEAVIPAEAKLIVKLDVQACHNNPIIQQKLHVFQQDTFKKLQGINWEKPIYIFVTPNEYIGAIASVSEEESLLRSLHTLPANWQPTKNVVDDDATWSTLKNGWQIACRTDVILLMGPGSQQEAGTIRQTMREILNEDYDESFLSTPYYKVLNQLKGDINMISHINVLPIPYNLFMKLQLPESISSQQTYLSSEIKVYRDKLSIQNTLNCNDEKTDEILQCQKSPQLKYFKSFINTNNGIILYMHTYGKKLLRTLREDQNFRAMLAGMNQVIDADLILRAIKGEVLLQIQDMNSNEIPTFTLQAQLANQKFLEKIPDWQKSAKGKKDMFIRPVRGGYEVSYKNNHFFLKAENNQLLLSSKPNVQQSLSKSSPQIKQSTTYMSINFAQLWRQTATTQKNYSVSLQQTISDQLKLLEFKAKDSKYSTINIYFR